RSAATNARTTRTADLCRRIRIYPSVRVVSLQDTYQTASNPENLHFFSYKHKVTRAVSAPAEPLLHLRDRCEFRGRNPLSAAARTSNGVLREGHERVAHVCTAWRAT